jgi:GT2 family glycosyltransferase
LAQARAPVSHARTPVEMDATDPLVVIVVLNWNGREDSKECLESLRLLTYERRKVLLVDNGSTDGSADMLREQFPEAEILQTGRNLGYARGNNAGIGRALETGADFIVLLNNDTTAESDFVTKLVEEARGDETIGVIGPRIHRYDRRDRVWFAGGRVNLLWGWTRHVGNGARDRGQFRGTVDEDYQTGAAMMISRKALAQLGMLDPEYVSYFEDTDFCLRARAAGFRVVCRRDALVYHKISRSTGGGLSPAKAYRKILSGARFFRRHAGRLRYYTTIAAFNFAYGLVLSAAALASGKPAVTGAIFRGFVDLFRGRDRTRDASETG